MGKFYKKSAILAVLMLLCMPLVACSGARYKGGAKAPAANASAGVAVPATASVWDGDLAAAGWGGTVAAPDTYKLNATAKTLEIGSAAALAYFSHEVYADKDAHALDGYSVKLTCDIDLGGDANIWIPIGSTGRPKETTDKPVWRFAGTFDGDGHTIYNLTSKGFYDNMSYDSDFYISYVNADTSLNIPFETRKNEEYCYGLFGTVANFTVKNLNMSGVAFDMPSKNVGGHDLVTDGVGAIVGYGVGSFAMQNCTAGTPDGDDYMRHVMTTGGLAGRIYAQNHTEGDASVTPYQTVSIENCTNYITLGSPDDGDKKSGIIGMAQFFVDCTIKNCTNYGDILGGLYCGGITAHIMGSASGANLGDITIENCVNYGNVATSDVGNSHAGGIVGIFQFGSNELGDVVVRSCTNYGDVKCNVRVGGLTGWIQMYEGQSVTIDDFYNYGDVVGSGVCGGVFGWVNVTAPRFTGGFLGSLKSESANSGALVGLDNTGNKFTPALFINAGNRNGAAFTASAEGGTAETSATLALSEDGKTVLGLDGVPEGKYSVEIPATAERIAPKAFAGQKDLVELTFAQNSALKEIGDFAFAGTGISAVALPDGVVTLGDAAFGECGALDTIALSGALETIGQAAFGNCGKLLYAELNGSDDIKSVGKYAFDGAVNVVAENAAQYKKLNAVFGDISITFPVRIDYNYLGSVLDSETRLFGKAYNYVRGNDGKWQLNDSITELGTPQTGALVWYGNASCTGDPVQMSGMNALLAADDCGDVITLYATVTAEGERLFVARDNIVYDENVSYDVNELNPLLAAASSPITPAMTVTVDKFTDPDGNVKTVAKVGAAGVYEIKVVEGDKNYTFKIKIARKTVDLGSYDHLFWKLTGVGETATDEELRGADGITLYLYETADGGVIPCYSQLDADSAAALGVDKDAYTTKTVRYSVVRNRGEETPVKIELAADSAYTAAYTETTNIANAVGVYTARVELTADVNCVLALGGTRPTDANTRGLTVTVGADGRSAVVEKVWYVVDIGNWFVGINDEEYRIADRVYGDTTVITAPRLKYGHDADKVRFDLFRGSEQIGGTFTADEFAYYMSAAMPAGSYRLVARADATEGEEYDADDIAHENPRTVKYDAFTRTFRFTVDKATFADDALERIDEAIKGKRYTYAWTENTSHLYDAEAATVIASTIAGFIAPARGNSVWENSAYDAYFGDARIMFNLSRMQSDVYMTADDLSATCDPDRYVIYYCIDAPNYYSSIESTETGSRTDYYFEVVNIREIALPVISAKPYNGEIRTADVSGNAVYSVKINNGGKEAKTYDVVLEFNAPDYYMWEGQTLATKTAEYTLEFTVTKAVNEWRVLPSVQNWVDGKFDAEENRVVGESVFGKAHIVITDSADKVVYDNFAEINELASARAGDYKLTATIDDTGDYYGLTHSMFLHVYDVEGMAWWVTLLIVLGVVIVIAVVIIVLIKTGVVQILTGKLALAIRSKATIDATVAAVRANKRAEDARRQREEEEKREKARLRREAAAAERNKPIEEKAAALENKAKAAAERAERMRARAEAMQAKAEAMKARAAEENATSAEPAQPQAEAAATETPDRSE